MKFETILEVKGGQVEAIESVRTKTKAHNRLIELFKERVVGRTQVHLATQYANAPDDA